MDTDLNNVAGKLKWTAYTARDGSKKTSLCVLARMVKRLAPAPLLVGTPDGDA